MAPQRLGLSDEEWRINNDKAYAAFRAIQARSELRVEAKSTFKIQ